jgi:hypothetical protein
VEPRERALTEKPSPSELMSSEPMKPAPPAIAIVVMVGDMAPCDVLNIFVVLIMLVRVPRGTELFRQLI